MPPTENSLHIAIIPDGNRRWAKQRSLAPWKGHEQSAETFEEIVTCCRDDPRVGVFTIWVFSTENWKRDPKEVAKLMEMFEHYLTTKRETFHENKTRLLHSGRKDRLTPTLRTLLTDIAAETEQYADFVLHTALDYGGQDEILRAANHLLEQREMSESSQPIDDQQLRAHLDQPDLPDIDLIIRTSGEQRTSNFFLWQSTYAEWFFTDTLFPDFTAADLTKILDDFSERSRRFGS